MQWNVESLNHRAELVEDLISGSATGSATGSASSTTTESASDTRTGSMTAPQTIANYSATLVIEVKVTIWRVSGGSIVKSGQCYDAGTVLYQQATAADDAVTP